MFFLEQVLQIITRLKLTGDGVERIKQYCNLMLNQLNFVLSFIEDLLDLQQVKSGAL